MSPASLQSIFTPPPVQFYASYGITDPAPVKRAATYVSSRRWQDSTWGYFPDTAFASASSTYVLAHGGRKELITRKRHACAQVLDKPYPQWEGPFSPNRVFCTVSQNSEIA